METIIENLSKEEFFGGNGLNNPGIHLQNRTNNSNKIGNIFIWMCVGGFIGYLFREDIESFLQRLFKKSSGDTYIS